MRQTILIFFGTLGVICIGYVAKRPRSTGSSEAAAASGELSSIRAETQRKSDKSETPATIPSDSANSPSSSATQSLPAAAQETNLLRPAADRSAAASGVAAAPASAIDPDVITRAIDTLLNLESTYGQRQSALRQLIQTGKLDQAIAALEQKRAAEPEVADYAATLGHAYIKKCGATQDVREQATLAMQADKLFDSALSLDVSNWEARFTKAVAMSYWPANLNKGEEVIGHFQTLIQQQELTPAKPEFAETYLWLGDQYHKLGSHEEALAVWQRGTALFPSHQALQNRLTAQTH